MNRCMATGYTRTVAGGLTLPETRSTSKSDLFTGGTSWVERVAEEVRAPGLMAVRTWGKAFSHRDRVFADLSRLGIGKHRSSVR